MKTPKWIMKFFRYLSEEKGTKVFWILLILPITIIVVGKIQKLMCLTALGVVTLVTFISITYLGLATKYNFSK